MRKYILVVTVLLLSQLAAAQTDTAHTVDSSGTLNLMDTSFIWIKAASDSSAVLTSWHDYYNQYRDTCIYAPDAKYITPIVNSFSYSRHNSDYSHDTAFTYNHYWWLLQQVRREKEYWIKKIRATNDVFKKVDYRMNYDYYNGMDDLLSDMLYMEGKTKWKFKSKKVK